MDIYDIIKYLAVNAYTVNFDSYSGSGHNYYLLDYDGVFTIIPWDFNMAFSGFGNTDASQAINYSIDSPVTGDISDKPLVNITFSIDKYQDYYFSILDTIANEYFESIRFENLVDNINNMINIYVEDDPTAFANYESYLNAIDTLKTFVLQRSESVNAQLSGDEDFYIETDINLNDLGEKANPGRANGPGNINDFPGNNEMPLNEANPLIDDNSITSKNKPNSKVPVAFSIIVMGCSIIFMSFVKTSKYWFMI